MKKIIFTLCLLCVLPVTVVTAQTPIEPVTGDYVTLAPLPGTTKDPNCTGNNCVADINSYLSGFLGLAISIGAIIAMLYIAYYGFLYALSDSASVKMEKKGKIIEILEGLFLIIASYAIMYTINPNLVNNLSLQIDSPKLNDPTINATTTPGTLGGFIDNVTETAVREYLKGRVSVNAGPCAVNQTKNCTNVGGLPAFAIDRLVSLKSECNCDIMITGGTEGGHATHGPGKPIVDLNPSSSLNAYLGKPNPKEAEVVTKVVNGKTVTFTYETFGGNANGTSSGNHWHVVIN